MLKEYILFVSIFLAVKVSSSEGWWADDVTRWSEERSTYNVIHAQTVMFLSLWAARGRVGRGRTGRGVFVGSTESRMEMIPERGHWQLLCLLWGLVPSLGSGSVTNMGGDRQFYDWPSWWSSTGMDKHTADLGLFLSAHKSRRCFHIFKGLLKKEKNVQQTIWPTKPKVFFSGPSQKRFAAPALSG